MESKCVEARRKKGKAQNSKRIAQQEAVLHDFLVLGFFALLLCRVTGKHWKSILIFTCRLYWIST